MLETQKKNQKPKMQIRFLNFSWFACACTEFAFSQFYKLLKDIFFPYPQYFDHFTQWLVWLLLLLCSLVYGSYQPGLNICFRCCVTCLSFTLCNAYECRYSIKQTNKINERTQTCKHWYLGKWHRNDDRRIWV